MNIIGGIDFLKKTTKHAINCITKWSTPIIAILGLILGGVNTYTIIDNNKTNIKIIPLIHAQLSANTALTAEKVDLKIIPFNDAKTIKNKGKIAFTIINNSKFPIYIIDTGFSKNTKLNSDLRIFIKRPFLIQTTEQLLMFTNKYNFYPIKLNSRESITLLVKDIKINDILQNNYKYFYVNTTTNETFYSKITEILIFLSQNDHV